MAFSLAASEIVRPNVMPAGMTCAVRADSQAPKWSVLITDRAGSQHVDGAKLDQALVQSVTAGHSTLLC